MQADDVEVVDVMFPEGCTLVQAAAKLQEAEVCDGQKFLFYFNQGNLGYKFEEYLPKTNSSLKFAKWRVICSLIPILSTKIWNLMQFVRKFMSTLIPKSHRKCMSVLKN